MPRAQAKRRKERAKGNTRLKRLVAELSLAKQGLREGAQGNCCALRGGVVRGRVHGSRLE